MKGEQDSDSGEVPQHSVTLSSGFWMGKYELTQAQWKAVMGGANPSYFQGANAMEGEVELNTDNRPVEQVSWDAITQTFLPALKALTGLTFRLPTEAQWEYAARAGTQTRFYWGDDPGYTEIGSYAWYWDNNTPWGTKDVGGKLPNNFGLYDMSGNVWEWVEDDWHSDYTGASLDGSAWVDNPRGSYRVGRGGSWYYDGRGCRSATRHGGNPSSTRNGNGFRLSR
jgi:formylglycine-generating enzyme required for sulfatase activity